FRQESANVLANETFSHKGVLVKDTDPVTGRPTLIKRFPANHPEEYEVTPGNGQGNDQTQQAKNPGPKRPALLHGPTALQTRGASLQRARARSQHLESKTR